MKLWIALGGLLVACGSPPPHLDHRASPRHVAPPARPALAGSDSDGDGLSDFAEVHTYGTDPRVPDAAERDEHAYSIVDTVELVKPIDLAAMTDDYQEARLVSETARTAVVEVRSFPLGTAAQAVGENPRWRTEDAADPRLAQYLAPGATADWDEPMRRELVAALHAAGIDPDRLTDRELVRRVSAWIFGHDSHAFHYLNDFVGYDVRFDHGTAVVDPVLRPQFDDEKRQNHLASDAEAIALGVDGKGMFEARVHGDCTSSAILEETVLRALGIPTRIVLAIPLVDGNDPAQLAAIRHLTHQHVRNAIYRFQPRDSWASHTFDEVYVGHRWVPLYDTGLGASPLGFMGLMIRVETVGDWSESALARAWGEYAQHDSRTSPAFGYASPNPYRSLGLREHFGTRAQIANPPEPYVVWDLGFDFARSKVAHRVTGVRVDSAAAHAGLRDGQPLVGWGFYDGDPTRAATIQVRDHGRVRDLTYVPAREERW